MSSSNLRTRLSSTYTVKKRIRTRHVKMRNHARTGSRSLKIFALLTQAALPEPLPNISLKPSALGEGGNCVGTPFFLYSYFSCFVFCVCLKELYACKSASMLSSWRFANLIALGSVLKQDAPQERFAASNDWKRTSERTLRAAVETRPLPSHHSSVSHSVSHVLCHLSICYMALPLLASGLPQFCESCCPCGLHCVISGLLARGALVSAQCCVGSLSHRVCVWRLLRLLPVLLFLIRPPFQSIG